jgi:tRNA dimethylallyltransferase
LAVVRLPVIVGPTAVGKTAVALELGAYWPLEVVSADSRQVYRRLDVGTAKPTRRERLKVPHEGLDLVEPGERYSAGRFAQDAERWIAAIGLRGRLPVVVGGTGLYVRALVDGLFREPPLDPRGRQAIERWLLSLGTQSMVRWAARLDPRFKGGGRQRASRAIEVALLTGRPLSYWQDHAKAESPVRAWYVRLTAPRAVLHHRILVRSEEMVRRGLIEEAAAVLADGIPPDAPGLDGVGIREAVEYLQGRRERSTVAPAVATATRQYAKRQETWFRHQLGEPVLTLDATRPPDAIARDIALAWDRANSLPADAVHGEETG